MRGNVIFVSALAVSLLGCSGRTERTMRGIADKRTNFEKFLPMKEDASAAGLKPVEPFFRSGNRQAVLRAIEGACRGGRRGSSVYNPSTRAGYYVNCTPENRQLLNGYVPADSRRAPHSR